MPTLETFAARFARCVSLFRDPAAKDEQKAEFRALLGLLQDVADRKSTRLNSSHLVISYAVFCLKKKNLHISHVYLISATHLWIPVLHQLYISSSGCCFLWFTSFWTFSLSIDL